MPTVQIDGHKVAYEEAGLGLPILLLPGLIGSTEWFKYQYHGLGSSYRIISCELRQASRKPDYTIDLLVEDLAKFLAALRLHSVVLGGHSFGGMIAQQFALAYPQSVAALILVSSFSRLPKIPQANIAELLAPLHIPKEFPIRRLFGALTGRRAAAQDLEGAEWLAAHVARISRATINARVRLAASFDVTEHLGNIGIPALVIAGGNEDPVLLDAAQGFYENLPDATLEVIEGGDHFSFFTRHDLFNAVVDDFLSSRMTALV